LTSALSAADEEAAALALLTPEAVRERSRMVLAVAEADALAHFAYRHERLDAVADFVAETIRDNYPDLAVPYHSRWRHFIVDGEDRWQSLVREYGLNDTAELSRAAFDLAVVSVLLDAGAGPGWRYRDERTGRTFARSEGLAIASLAAFAGGLFSSKSGEPLRADAPALRAIEAGDLAEAFQAGVGNSLVGLEGRAALLRALGDALDAQREVFGAAAPRVGGLFDHLSTRVARAGALPAREILVAVLTSLGSIWPGRLQLGGRNLGDTWRHEAVTTHPPTTGMIPFHKLSLWLAYSLVEPLEWAGVEVTSLDSLTGLAEYRNGGLFIDLGVLEPKRPEVLTETHQPGSQTIVEWRALTVALLDRIAPLVRERLQVEAAAFPLAKVLEGGTWSAGRRIAAQKRPGGGPPIVIASDGAVF
jgi:hypothetical protein